MGQKQAVLSVVAAPRRTRILVADPYPVVVHGLRKMLEDDLRFQVVAEASTLASFQKKIIAQRPDVAFLDWYMASQDLELTTGLLQSELHNASIIFLTVSENSEQKRDMLRLGARAFLSKWCTAVRLKNAISKACLKDPGVSVVDAARAGAVPSLPIADAEERFRQLTQRERQLIPLISSGLKNKEIALRLGISESTVWHHLTAVFTKLQVEDRLGLAAFAYSHPGLFPGLQSRPAAGLRVLEAFPGPHAESSAAAEERSLNG